MLAWILLFFSLTPQNICLMKSKGRDLPTLVGSHGANGVPSNHQGRCLAFGLCFYVDFLLPCLTPHRRQPGGPWVETRNQGPLTNAAKRRFTTKQLGLKVLKVMDKNSDVGTNLQISSKLQLLWFVLCTCVFTSPSNAFRSFWWHFENRLPQEKYRSNSTNRHVQPRRSIYSKLSNNLHFTQHVFTSHVSRRLVWKWEKKFDLELWPHFCQRWGLSK